MPLYLTDARIKGMCHHIQLIYFFHVCVCAVCMHVYAEMFQMGAYMKARGRDWQSWSVLCYSLKSPT